MAEIPATEMMGEAMPEAPPPADPDFPHAPPGWTRSRAEEMARREGLALGPDHWELVRALQKWHARHEDWRVRALTDALEEHFHLKGGMRYLRTLFPGGPITQGCRLAGLEPPPGSVDPGFGTAL